MARLVRSLLLWLAMSALSLHGFAFGAGAMEDRDFGRSMQAADAHRHEKVTPMLGARACDRCPQDLSRSPSSHGQCTASAACCLVAAPAFAGITVGEPDAGAQAPPCPRAARVVFLTGGPERPPRG
jgi:hypothetical protein